MVITDHKYYALLICIISPKISGMSHATCSVSPEQKFQMYYKTYSSKMNGLEAYGPSQNKDGFWNGFIFYSEAFD